MTAFVFNCHYNGLSIIQELGRRGVAVMALDSIRSIGTYSRYARYYKCPDPQVEEDAFVDYLIHMGPTFDDKPVLFPTNDHWAVAISRHKDQLSRYYFPCVADKSVIDIIIYKQRFFEWAMTQGFPVPYTWRSDDASQIPESAYPIVVKPEYRRISSNERSTGQRAVILDELRLTILQKKTDLVRFVSQYNEVMPFLIFQEYVAGLSDCMYTVGVYADSNHSVKGIFTGRKVRGFPPDSGDCIVGQVEEVPEDLKSLVKQICKSIGYQGIAEFEFKKDVNTGQFKLIEINPRSWSWIGITPFCGVSLPWIAYADLTGIEEVVYTECKLPTGNVKYVKLLEDMQNCMYRNRSLGYKSWHMSFPQWLQSLRSEKIVFAEFSRDDLLPGIRSIYAMLRGFAGMLIHKVM